MRCSAESPGWCNIHVLPEVDAEIAQEDRFRRNQTSPTQPSHA
jgi:hypothetical protein